MLKNCKEKRKSCTKKRNASERKRKRRQNVSKWKKRGGGKRRRKSRKSYRYSATARICELPCDCPHPTTLSDRLQYDEKAKQKQEEELKKSKVVEAQRSTLMSFLKTPGGLTTSSTSASPAAGASVGATNPSTPATSVDAFSEIASVKIEDAIPASTECTAHRQVDLALLERIDSAINVSKMAQ